jgi:hypothetical protein
MNFSRQFSQKRTALVERCLRGLLPNVETTEQTEYCDSDPQPLQIAISSPLRGVYVRETQRKGYLVNPH